MPTLRSRKLESLLGGPIDHSLTFDQVGGLIPNAVEGPDLDFKQNTYGNKLDDKKELCGDVGGLANANGGIIVLGIEEDDQARAFAYHSVETSDDERRRLRQTIVGNLQPTPSFDVVPVEDPNCDGRTLQGPQPPLGGAAELAG
jgi:Schlafen, AlbA_2